MQHRPRVLAFGQKARSGKGECAQYLYRTYGKKHKILLTSFAKALRSEIERDVCSLINALDVYSPKAAMMALCSTYNVCYDPSAPIEPDYPYTKQRELLQVVGMKRRQEDRDYWVKQVEAEVARVQPDILILDDARFLNEVLWVEELGGTTVEVVRPGTALSGVTAQHISENALNGYQFGHRIVNDGTLEELYAKADAIFQRVIA